MLKDNMLAYAEVDEILKLLEKEYRERVPEKIRKFFREERMPDYNPEIEIDKPLAEQELKRETVVLLSILNINYWCDSEEEKQFYLDELAKNEKEKKELEERYNPDNLFKNRTKEKEQITTNSENIQLIEYKEQGFIKKLLHKIMSFFRK